MLSLPTFALCFTLDATPSPPLESALLAPGAATRAFVSRTLGSHMVLQAAPQQATVWGFASAGTTVKVTMDGAHPMTATSDATGVWRQKLPATAGSDTPHTIMIQGSGGQTAAMHNVLFGDVYLCGGQSAAQSALPSPLPQL